MSPADADTNAKRGQLRAAALLPTDSLWEALTARALDCAHSSINADQKLSQYTTAFGQVV